MIEIIALIFLTKEIGKLAHSKGLKAGTWKIYLVAGWFIFEFFGIVAGVIIFGKDNLISIALVGIAFAITSYFLIKGHLNKLPDHDFDDDINNIGRN